MNLIEAIRSGKPFKRKTDDEDSWWFIQNEMITYEWGPKHGMPPPGLDEEDPALWSYIGEGSSYGMQIEIQDLLANDWEILEPSVTITRTQFWEAVRILANRGELLSPQLMFGHVLIKELADKLGLGEPK